MDFFAFLIALVLHLPLGIQHPAPAPPEPPAKHHVEAPEPTQEPSDEPSVGDDDSEPTECAVFDEDGNELGPCDGTFYFN